jgi:tetratricopeptide (TPR) repeat protein
VNLFSGKPSSYALLSKLQAAYDLKQQNRFQEALDLLNKIIKQVPDNAKALAYRGEIYGQLGNIPAALEDLERSVHFEPFASTYFNLALAHFHSNQKSEALATLFRVLQLEPNDKEAWSFRERLAKELGLEDLEIIARVVEQFMYSHCGPGIGWKVELRHLYRFIPNEPHEEYNAVILDLCQEPLALIQIQPAPTEYKIIVNVEKSFPETSQRTFADVITKVIPTHDADLLNILNGFIEDGVLIQENNRLRYSEKPKAT